MIFRVLVYVHCEIWLKDRLENDIVYISYKFLVWDTEVMIALMRMGILRKKRGLEMVQKTLGLYFTMFAFYCNAIVKTLKKTRWTKKINYDKKNRTYKNKTIFDSVNYLNEALIYLNRIIRKNLKGSSK